MYAKHVHTLDHACQTHAYLMRVSTHMNDINAPTIYLHKNEHNMCFKKRVQEHSFLRQENKHINARRLSNQCTCGGLSRESSGASSSPCSGAYTNILICSILAKEKSTLCTWNRFHDHFLPCRTWSFWFTLQACSICMHTRKQIRMSQVSTSHTHKYTQNTINLIKLLFLHSRPTRLSFWGCARFRFIDTQDCCLQNLLVYMYMYIHVCLYLCIQIHAPKFTHISTLRVRNNTYIYIYIYT